MEVLIKDAKVGAFNHIWTILLKNILRIATFSWILVAIWKKVAILERYQMGLYHILKGTSQANFVQTMVLLTKFERFLLKTAGLFLRMAIERMHTKQGPVSVYYNLWLCTTRANKRKFMTPMYVFHACRVLWSCKQDCHWRLFGINAIFWKNNLKARLPLEVIRHKCDVLKKNNLKARLLLEVIWYKCDFLKK